MVVGADVTHPGAKQASHDIPFSIAAVTATVSYNLMKYVAAIRRQRFNDKTKNGLQEIIEEMKDMFCEQSVLHMGCLLMLLQNSFHQSGRSFLKCHENLFSEIPKCQPVNAA